MDTLIDDTGKVIIIFVLSTCGLSDIFFSDCFLQDQAAASEANMVPLTAHRLARYLDSQLVTPNSSLLHRVHTRCAKSMPGRGVLGEWVLRICLVSPEVLYWLPSSLSSEHVGDGQLIEKREGAIGKYFFSGHAHFGFGGSYLYSRTPRFQTGSR